MRNVVVKGRTAFLAALFDNVMPTDHPEIFLMPWQDRFELLHSFFLGFFAMLFQYPALFFVFSPESQAYHNLYFIQHSLS